MSWIPFRPQVNLPLLKSLLLNGNSPSCICMSKGLLHAIKFAGHFSLTAKLKMTVQRRCIDLILQKNGKTQKMLGFLQITFAFTCVSVQKGKRKKWKWRTCVQQARKLPCDCRDVFFQSMLQSLQMPILWPQSSLGITEVMLGSCSGGLAGWEHRQWEGMK